MQTTTESGGADLMSDGVLPVPAAAQFMGISRSTLYELLGTGELVSIKIRGKRVVPRKALVAFLHQCAAKAA